MITINTDEMQRDLPTYLKRVSAGETLLIMQDNKPFAELKPIFQPEPNLCPFGLCAAEFTVPPDFDAPLAEDVLINVLLQ